MSFEYIGEGLSEELWSLMDSTCTIMSYKDNKSMYKFTLSAGQGNNRVVRIEREGNYFYCDMGTTAQTLFIGVYQEICKNSVATKNCR